MEQSNAPTTKGKGLGMAGMIIGIVCAVLAIIPGMAMVMMVIAIVGLILSAIGLAQASKGGNPNKGVMITGLILNLLVVIYAIVQIVFLASAVGEGLNELQNGLQEYSDSVKNAQ
jgi:uncharacterized membrane protein YjgN (DUF898 family)